MLVKLFVTVFCLFALSRVAIRVRKNEVSFGEFLFWCAIWISIIVIVFIPGVTDYFAKFIGFRRGLDAIVSLSIVALFYSIYRLYAKIENVEKEITEIVRKEALRKFNEE